MLPTRPRALPAVLVTAAVLASLLAADPAAAATPRVHVTAVKPAWATAKADLGTADATDETVTAQIALELPDTQAAIDFAVAVSTPGNPQYGKTLAPADWIARFSPTQAAVDAVTQSASAAGLTIVTVPASRLFVLVTGSGEAMDSYFATQVHAYRVDGDIRFAAAGSVTLPARAGRLVQAVTFDHTRMASQRVTPASALAALKTKVKRAKCSAYWKQHTVRIPSAYGQGTASTMLCGYTAKQVRALYGLTGSTLDGRGQKVAVIDAYGSPTARADLATYSARNGLPAARYTEHVPDPSTWDTSCGPEGWAGEQTLDIEAVHAVAPRAEIVYVGATDCSFGMDVAMSKTLDEGLASIVSNSWGGVALDTAAGLGLTSDQDDAEIVVNLHQHIQAAGQGVGLYFASGDQGDNEAVVGFRAVDFPASSPFVTAVGGTSAGLDAKGRHLFSAAWGENVAVSDGTRWLTGLPGAFAGGAGGGRSSLFDRPWYQESGSARAATDVSAIASSLTGLAVGQRIGGRYTVMPVGGTSLATPIVAAQVALAQQAAGRTFGFVNPALYRVAAKGKTRDVVKSSVRRAVVVATAGKAVALVTIDRDSSLTARRGYDYPTGVGELTLTSLKALARG